MKTATQLRRSKAYIVILLALAQVREVNPRLGAQRGSPLDLQRVEHAIAEGQKLQRIDPHRAIGFYLGGLEGTGIAIQKDPRNPLACVIMTSPCRVSFP